MEKKESASPKAKVLSAKESLVPELFDPKLKLAAREAAESARRAKAVWEALHSASRRVVKRLRDAGVLTSELESQLIDDLLDVAELEEQKILTPHTLAEGEVDRRFAVRRLTLNRRRSDGEAVQP